MENASRFCVSMGTVLIDNFSSPAIPKCQSEPSLVTCFLKCFIHTVGEAFMPPGSTSFRFTEHSGENVSMGTVLIDNFSSPTIPRCQSEPSLLTRFLCLAVWFAPHLLPPSFEGGARRAGGVPRWFPLKRSKIRRTAAYSPPRQAVPPQTRGARSALPIRLSNSQFVAAEG